MKKILSGLLVLGLLFGFSTSAVAQGTTHHLNNSGANPTLVLPENAKHSPVIALGSAIDPRSGEVVQGFAIVHYRDSFAKGGGGRGSGGSTCYAFLASGAKWKTVEPWVLNASNEFGLTDNFLLATQSADITKWETNAGVNILGTGSLTTDILEADTVSPDNLNEVYFGTISDAGVIAVTIVWGQFYGPPKSRSLIEWDMVFNTDYDWSATGEAGKMDFENISTHELGHAVGLADLYTSGCLEETMYGYADFGETSKRSLNVGDIAGIGALY